MFFGKIPAEGNLSFNFILQLNNKRKIVFSNTHFVQNKSFFLDEKFMINLPPPKKPLTGGPFCAVGIYIY